MKRQDAAALLVQSLLFGGGEIRDGELEGLFHDIAGIMTKRLSTGREVSRVEMLDGLYYLLSRIPSEAKEAS